MLSVTPLFMLRNPHFPRGSRSPALLGTGSPGSAHDFHTPPGRHIVFLQLAMPLRVLEASHSAEIFTKCLFWVRQGAETWGYSRE